MAAGVKDITLEQLLSPTSGIAGDRVEHIPLITYSVTDDRPPISTACAPRSSPAW